MLRGFGMLLPYLGGVDALLLLVIAIVLDACVGDSPWLARLLPTPATLVARLTARLDRRLNRIDRSEAARRARGALVSLCLLLGALSLGLVLAFAFREVRWGAVPELLLLARALSIRSAWTGMGQTLKALESGGVEAGREAVAPLTDRQTWSLDIHGVLRAAIEGGMLRLACGLAAPLFWYAVLGLPGLLGWAAIDGMAQVIGHDVPRFRQFGGVVRQLRRLAGWPPMLLATLALLLAGLFVPGCKALGGWRELATARRHPWGPLALPVAAAAGALDLAMAGPRREGEQVVKEPWLGRGRARATSRDLRAAMALYGVAGLLLVGLTVSAGLIAAGLGL
ncbi:adenosylcobinamide-phosphate synthase [Azospirillum sp. RU38E]|nr:adenosylcobinamide-phosphate synthase [Azospirillum sp. RU38E]SNS06654.1 adenosylcobinamide-phosphate synthase [Azospirillum sp. RU37A]